MLQNQTCPGARGQVARPRAFFLTFRRTIGHCLTRHWADRATSMEAENLLAQEPEGLRRCQCGLWQDPSHQRKKEKN